MAAALLRELKRHHRWRALFPVTAHPDVESDPHQDPAGAAKGVSPFGGAGAREREPLSPLAKRYAAHVRPRRGDAEVDVIVLR
jgi:hypothetical protein